MNRKQLKVIGVYALVILSIIRFLLLPLHRSVSEKKALLGEAEETYRMRVLQVERQKVSATLKAKDSAGDIVLKGVYGKDTGYNTIQTETLGSILGLAAKRGLAVVNFELPDAVVLTDISEVPIILRLKGDAPSLKALLKDIGGGDKIMRIKNFETALSGGELSITITASSFRLER